MCIAKFILPAFLFFSVMCSAQTTLTSQEITHFKSKIAAQVQNTQTISGEFLQKKHLAFLQNDMESSGKFFFSSPNKIKWSYLKPYQYSVIFKNNKLYINDEGKKNTIDIGKNEMLDRLNQLIVNSINGKMLQSEDFDITYRQNAEFFIANLQPTDPTIVKLFKKIQLSFDKSNYKIHQVKLVGPSGDYTQIYFTQLQTNVSLDDSVFQF